MSMRLATVQNDNDLGLVHWTRKPVDVRFNRFETAQGRKAWRSACGRVVCAEKSPHLWFMWFDAQPHYQWFGTARGAMRKGAKEIAKANWWAAKKDRSKIEPMPVLVADIELLQLIHQPPK